MKISTGFFLTLILLIMSGCFSKSVDGLKQNYDENATKINELKEYFLELVPNDYLVRIQYNAAHNVDLFVYAPIEKSTQRKALFSQWDVDLDSYQETPHTDYELKYGGETKSLEVVKERLGWTRETFEELYEKLEDVDCIGICNRTPVEIEFGFKGMGLLSYLIFDEDLSPEQQDQYSNGCSQKYYKANVVLQFGSGATGSLCIPEFKKD